jgi:hypothetical protein
MCYFNNSGVSVEKNTNEVFQELTLVK